MGLSTLDPHRRSQTLWHPEPGCPWSDLCPLVFRSLCSPRKGDKMALDSPRAWTPCLGSSCDSYQACGGRNYFY